MSEYHITPTTRPLRGVTCIPADKSITHRAAILGALANGDTRIENYLPSNTTSATLNGLRALGVNISQPDPATLIIHGRGLHSLQEPSDILSCAGSGTTMRLLAGVCAGMPSLSILDGTPELKRRPMARIVEPLIAMGAMILARDEGHLPPLAIRGGNLHGIDYTLAVASAQVKSAILLAGLFGNSPTTVREPKLSRDHTERMLKASGVKISNAHSAIHVHPTATLHVPTIITVPSDFSSAAFFITSAVLLPHSEIRLERIGVNPTRTGLLNVLERMGAFVKIENLRAESGEPIADLVVQAHGNLRAIEISGDVVPCMIDEFPIFAIAATQAEGETCVRDAQELRVKESDRIATLVLELSKMGAQIEERPDGMIISGPTPLQGARVSAHHDHRLAMSLAIAGLLSSGETIVEDWECITDSFPNFVQVLHNLLR